MSELSDLIAKLGQATEGSRELDAEIAVVTFSEPHADDDLIYARRVAQSDNCAPGTFWRKCRSGLSLRMAPPYTTSIDAKLPGENIISVMFTSERWSALHDHGDDPPLVEGIGNTEALARRIAALKARAKGGSQP